MSDVTAARKTVTVLFSDLAESTSLAERLDPEALARLLDAYFNEMRSIVTAHGGTVEKFIGDAVVGVFGVPAVHEDDAARAVGAGLAMQEAIGRLPETYAIPDGVELRARIGINTGQVVVTSVGDSLALGHAMNMAARLQQVADAGDVLIGSATRSLVADAFDTQHIGELEIKGSSEPVSAWRVVGSRKVAAQGWDGRGEFVGRERELTQVMGAIEDASRSGTSVSIVVLAPPGMGKSRLAAEVGRQVANTARVLVGRCLPYGEALTYAPLVDIARQLVSEDGENAVREAMLGESDAALVESVINLTLTGASQSSPDEMSWAFRRLFESLAAKHPLVVMIDDLHWADPLLLDLAEYISAFSAGVPLTLMALARPELLDLRPTLLTSQARLTVVRLDPLSATDMEALLASTDMGDEARKRIADAAGGVPLFVEQMMAYEHEGNAEVPPTIRSLLAARVDRLDPFDRQLLEVASIEGETFAMGTVADLTATESRSRIGGRLIALVQRDYIRPEHATAGHDSFRFSHALVRDAVYDQVPRAVRADLHERYADLLRASANGSAQADVIGHHLAAAHAELAALGDRARAAELAGQAATALGAAGGRAVARKQWRRGAELLGQARDLLADDPASSIRFAPEMMKAYDGLGDRKAGEQVGDAALADARRMGDRTTELRIEIAAAMNSVSTIVSTPDFHDLSDVALEYFGQQSDDWNLADAWILKAMSIGRGDPAAQAKAFLNAQLHADKSGNEYAQIVIWDELGFVLLIGETPFSRVRDHMEAEVSWAEERGIAFTAADGELGRAYCQHAAGELDEARKTLMRLHDIFASLPGDVSQYGESYQLSGAVERDADQPEAAMTYLQKAREAFDAIGSKSWWHGSSSGLAHAYLDAGQVAEAEAVLAEIRARAMTGTTPTEPSEITALARLASARGDHAQALTLMGDAVVPLGSGVTPQRQGRTLEYVADINEAAGNQVDARSALERALELYAAKEFELGRSRVADRLRSMGGSPVA